MLKPLQSTNIFKIKSIYQTKVFQTFVNVFVGQQKGQQVTSKDLPLIQEYLLKAIPNKIDVEKSFVQEICRNCSHSKM